MHKETTKRIGRHRRHARIRAKVMGTQERPRFAVYKSNRYLHVQLIDDAAGKTLVAASTKELGKTGTKTAAAEKLGAALAKKAKTAGISAVVFDRGGFRYTGRVAALAKAAREAGLTF
jgi:large subunit ribosomal protein L18